MNMSTGLTSPHRLRVLSYGAGAIGTYIGGSLALHGHSVVFLERPQVAAELRRRGLRLSLPSGTHAIESPQIAGSLDEALGVGPFDVALFALKSFDTQTALEGLRPQADRIPPVLCLQNGVENEPYIAGLLGQEKVISGTVTSAIGRVAPGEIILERLRGVGVAAGHPLSAALVQALDGAGLNAHLFPRASDMKWSKLLTNLLANATSAILDMTPAQVFAHPGLYRLEIAQLREALQVMRAQGIGVIDLPRTPVRLLAFAVRWLPLALSRPLVARAVGSGRGAKMPSFHIDLHAGRGQSEVDYLNGAVARFGARLGLPTPANRTLNETLLAIARGELSQEQFSHKPEALLERFRRAQQFRPAAPH
jgi:2-dehydropantoate 2-reductase